MDEPTEVKPQKHQAAWWRNARVIIGVVGATLLAIGFALYLTSSKIATSSQGKKTQSVKPSDESSLPGNPGNPDNPLDGRSFYVDASRSVNKALAEYKRKGDAANAELMERIASQPSAIWLTGPDPGDTAAQRDIDAVTRTSKEAARQGTVPVYQLYAAPHRDACAEYSKGGFLNSADYLAWIDKIISSLETEAVFSVEADAIAHTIKNTCLTPAKVSERYELLSKASAKLAQSSKVLGTYLDAGHSDWLPDPSVLVEPLRKSGIKHARGIAVNVSFYAPTADLTAWSLQLVELLGGNKGVIIDTSRNGQGIAHATGDARWCNPSGRGIGPQPTSKVAGRHIDAYVWIKTVGESDGNCFGNPAAGTFVPSLALELARNAAQ